MKITKFEDLPIWRLSLKITKGSVGEVRSQLYLSQTIRYISQEDFKRINNDLENLAGQVGGFMSYLSKKRENKEFINKK